VLQLAQSIAEQICVLDGVKAVVLGGSYAKGTATPTSDIDLSLYYDPAHPPRLDDLRTLAGRLDDEHRSEAVTEFGAWGPWINGGAWLTIQGQHVDWLYRDLARVEQEITNCEQGRVTVFYQPGHPHGFYNHIYPGEVHICRPLFDRTGRLAALKRRTAIYPPALKQALFDGLWEAAFSLQNAHKPAERGDIVTVVGHLYRALAVMIQAIFALNEQYCINEKGALALIESFNTKPDHFSARAAALLNNANISAMETLLHEVQTLVGNAAVS